MEAPRTQTDWRDRAWEATRLLEQAHSMIESLMLDRRRRSIVYLPPEGASLREIERAALVAALDRSNWVQAYAAKLIGLTPRVMNYKIRLHHLHTDGSPEPDSTAVVRGKPRGWWATRERHTCNRTTKLSSSKPTNGSRLSTPRLG